MHTEIGVRLKDRQVQDMSNYNLMVTWINRKTGTVSRFMEHGREELMLCSQAKLNIAIYPSLGSYGRLAE